MTKVLLVDDEHLILYALSRTLKQLGAEVTSATNGKDALSEIRRCPYDICFLDVHLPDANGLELLNDIRESSPLTAVVIMTAEHLEEKRIEALRSEGCRYLAKPFDLERVLALVEELSGTRRGAY